MTDILVTGGCGFIGSHLVDGLIAKGHRVRVLDRLEYQVHEGKLPNYLNPEAEYLFGDIRDATLLKTALSGMAVVFHQAAAVGVGQSMYEVERYVDINTAGTARLLQFLVNESHHVRKLVVASSMSVYGEGSYLCQACGEVYPQLRAPEQLRAGDWEMKCHRCSGVVKPKATGEDKPLHPTSVYAITKRDQEELCLVVGRAARLPTVALRYFNVYGPRQSLSNPYTGVAAIFLSRIKNNNPPLIFEDGHQTRDFIHVQDIVAANLLVMERPEADYGVFNVGTGRPTSILEVAQLLLDACKSRLKPTIRKEFRAGDIRHCVADVSRLAALGFAPRRALGDGMMELVDWSARVEAKDRVEEAEKKLREKGLLSS